MFHDYTVSAVVTPDGRLELTDRDAFSRAMHHFERGPVTVRIEVDKGRRNSQANRYLWLVYNLIADHTGDDPESLHEFFKRRFVEPEVVTVFGETLEVWSTADKDPQRFTDYVERVRQFAREEVGVETPDPDPALRGLSRKVRAA